MAEPGGSVRAGREMTLAEWADMDEDEPGELVDGILVEDEEVGALHDIVAAWFVALLARWLGDRGLVGLSDTRFGVGARRGRKPDVYAYLGDKRPPAEGLVTVPPDVMIEIVARRPRDARRDRVEKVTDYAAFGVRFYWIVDPALRSLEIFELAADGRYARALGAADGVVEDVPGCAGMEIDLDALWTRVDALETPGVAD
jgi:Uma2 family endonuclease